MTETHNTIFIFKIAKQWIKENVVNFLCETKSVSKQDALILIARSSKIVQWTKTMLSKLTTFPCIHWVMETKLFVLPYQLWT